MAGIPIVLNLNGQRVEIDVQPGENLLHTLRERFGLQGVKQSCDYGGCGACTVILDGKTVYSCMTLSCMVNNAKITTVEGLEDSDGGLSSLQEVFVKKWALQCGFCTPGILLSAKNLLAVNHRPSDKEIREILSGHICRCTGYLPIIEAIKEASTLAEE